MEERLRDLFDYQKFAQNPALQKLINETEGRYKRKKNKSHVGFSVVTNNLAKRSKELSEDDLSLLNAAGEAIVNPKTEKDPHA